MFFQTGCHPGYTFVATQEMSGKSAGILLYRQRGEIEFFLVHPGGPFWANKDLEAWSVPKGEYDGEDPQEAAVREFKEETGLTVTAELFPLGSTRLKSGKKVTAFGAKQDFDESTLVSNSFSLEWPPNSGKHITVPEVDKGAWFTYSEAGIKINPAQKVFLDRLLEFVSL